MQTIKLFVVALMIALISACDKSDFLNTKPSNSQIVPQTLSDLKQLLNNDNILNGGSTGAVPGLTIMASDEYYLESFFFPRLTPSRIAQYIWADDVFLDGTSPAWNTAYGIVYYSNVILDGIAKISVNSENAQQINAVKGGALFHRAFMYYSLAQIFVPYYSVSSIDSDLGLPLKLRADINEPIRRSTVQQTYDRILSDLLEAGDLLPNITPFKTQPSKAAAYGLLARVYQTLQDYDNALLYANLALEINNQLMDFNTLPLNTAGTFMIKRFNEEVIFHTRMGIDAPYTWASPDSILRDSYLPNDLRSTVFFWKNTLNTYYFIGSYNGDYGPFGGIATDELYLIKAECLARKGDFPAAMTSLNALLEKRFKAGTFVSLSPSSVTEALAIIFQERRRELVYRGTRWTDLRRLNAEGANIMLTRNFQGQIYTLSPNSSKWTYPIPPDVISFNPEMQQNPR